VTIPGSKDNGDEPIGGSPTVIPALANARSFAQAGRIAEAERLYNELLTHHPDNTEALAFLAQCALGKGQSQEAVQTLQRAHQLQANDPHILRNLGVAWDAVGDIAAARRALEASVALAPDGFQARLHLASVYERQGLAHEALVNYFRAITDAQLAGRWMDAASTPRGLQGKVIHAMDVAEHGRSRLFNECLAPLRARFGVREIGRIQHWLNEYLAFRLPVSTDPRQKPKFMYMPGLPSQPYYDRSLFPFIESIEDMTAVVRGEMLEKLDRNSGFVPFLGIDDASQLQGYLENAEGRPTWDAFFFYRHGSPVQENQQKCPMTASMLDNLPLVRIRDHAPEICFSVLTPGTHILPHYGVTNTRLVLHLPLVVPENCHLVVGDENHAWQEGRCVVFDDTYLHEAWNRGSSTRVVLIMDVWNPYLTEAERLAITELVGVIGDFNRASGI
jgi:aspartate beta-hydroxylase